MPSFTALRVLVTLVVTVSLLSVESAGRPLPSSTTIIKRAPIQLMSTSPTLPLPPSVIAGQRRTGSFTQQRPDPILLSRRDVDSAAVPRSDIHEHIHEHIHDHDSHDYGHYPDRWTKEEMDHHSDHWAYHHGLLDEVNAADVHAHIHEHIHKREEQMDERGLVGDVIRPLLAPLNVLPGFITISNLLFGDGAQDGGLLKTVGGLLLRVETQSPNEYSFSLLASKHQRTQVYLAPVNDTSCGDDSDDDSLTVKVTLPSIDINGAAILMCASFAVAPPSALTLESCHNDETSDSTSVNGTSQFFTYTRSTGSLAPVLQTQSSQKAVKAANTLTSVDDGATNTTTSADTTSDGAPMMSKLLMHFSLVSNITDTGDNTDETKADSANFPLADAAASSEGADMIKRSSRLVPRQSNGDGDAGDATLNDAADNTAASDDTSRIFLAATLMSDDAEQPGSVANNSTTSPTTNKLCKAKM